VIILVKAGAPVDATVAQLAEYMEPGDIIIDGGNEWYENTERRQALMKEKGIFHIGMGVSGGEEGARNGPAMMPGGDPEAYKHLQPIVEKVAAQTDDGACVTYIGKGGSGNYVKMVHNGIEYGDMQLIAEAYDVLRVVGGLTNPELAAVFDEWNKSELESFLVEITASIFKKKDEMAEGWLIDKVLDKTGMKGTGKWTIQQAAELSVAAPTMEAALDARFLSGLKDERVAAEAVYAGIGVLPPAAGANGVDKQQLVADVKAALFAAKVCSYAQGYNIIRAKSQEQGWDIDLGALARIWKGGCIIRAGFLDRIKQAYQRNPELPNLLVDPAFAQDLGERQAAWRRVVQLAVGAGIAVPGMTASLAYFDTYRRGRLPANLVQAQRDFFGSHTYERTDGKEGWFHTVWDPTFGSSDSITTTGYNQ
jgi:6-phosphogluconate dehydrogenase